MIYFCGEIYYHDGLICKINEGSSKGIIYFILGNKRIRTGRIYQWENENYRCYPRLKIYTTIPKFHRHKDKRWIKVEKQDHLMPYKYK